METHPNPPSREGTQIPLAPPSNSLRGRFGGLRIGIIGLLLFVYGRFHQG